MMAWGRRQHDETVAQEFRRALHRSAQDQVVSEAERMVRDLWLGELTRLKAQLKTEYTRAHDARAQAWAAVHDSRRAEDPQALAAARRELGETDADLCRCAEADRVLTEIAAEERNLMGLADDEADLVATANRIRVDNAWQEMRAVWAKQPAQARARGLIGF
ncbi:MAG TPA: hypothetical protein VGX23_03640 [Actinocrinis sp.]|nr:hypothetical protein [Actinocrinis sp.]